MTIFQIFDANGRKVGGDFSSRQLAMNAIPPAERESLNVLSIQIEEFRANCESAYSRTVVYPFHLKVF